MFRENIKVVDNLESEEESLSREIMSYFKVDGLPTNNPKWKNIVKNIEDEEYSVSELVEILVKVKQTSAKLDKNEEDFFEDSFDSSLSQEDILRTKKEIKLIIEDIEQGGLTDIGQGNSAIVFLDENYPSYCFKTLNIAAIHDSSVNTVREEAAFLDKASELYLKGVRAPKPYYFITDKEKNVQILIMETLKAVNVEDIINNKESVPENFDFEKSYTALEQYIVLLNNEKKINHNDICARNIMIDLDNLCFLVIDFGKSQKRADRHAHSAISADISNLRKFKETTQKYFNS